MQIKILAIAIGFSCVLAGCSNQIDSRLVGKWQIAKPESVNKRVAGKDEESEEELESRMTVEFFGSGKLTTTTKMGRIDSEKTGTWKALTEDRESNPIKIQCQIGLQQTDHEIELADDDSIRWIPPNMAGTKQKIRFVRAKD